MLLCKHAQSGIRLTLIAEIRMLFRRLRARIRIFFGKLRPGYQKLPTQKENFVKIEVQEFQCNATASRIQMFIPKIHPTLEVCQRDPTLLAAHIHFRYISEPWLKSKPEKSEKTFAKELNSIYMTFPSVSDKSTLLTMTAWFAILCKVDDIVEKLNVPAAKSALRLAKHSTMSDWQPDLNEWSNLEQHLSPEYVIHHIVRKFSLYSHNLLPISTYTCFMNGVNEIFDSMLIEMDFRASLPATVKSYMEIRKITIAISPFFTLLEGSLGMSTNSAALIELKEFLREACGLQNDLIGLDKDIHSEWPMNLVMVLRELKKNQLLVCGLEGEEQQTLLNSVTDVRDMHNKTVEKAVEIWRAIQSSDVESEKKLSNLMMVFVDRHFLWAVACKRYK